MSALMTDRALIERFTRAVLAEDTAAIEPHFIDGRVSPPSFRWNPDPAALREVPLKALLAWWQSLRPAHGLPSAEAVDPIALKDALGYLMILDVLEEGWDYRYRLYGTAIAQHAKQDYTGRRTSELKVASLIPTFYIACYRAVLLRPEPLMTRNEPPIDVATTAWTRLVLPLSGPGGKVTRFIVGNVPGSWRPPQEEAPT